VQGQDTKQQFIGIGAKSNSKTAISLSVTSVIYNSSMTQEDKLQQLVLSQVLLQKQLGSMAAKLLDSTTNFRQQTHTEEAKIKTELERLAIEAQVTTSKLKKVKTKLTRPSAPEMLSSLADSFNSRLDSIANGFEQFAKKVSHGAETQKTLDHIEETSKRMSWPSEDLRKASENLAKHSEDVSTRISEKRTFLYLYCGLGAVFIYACFVLIRARKLEKTHKY
jgi:methyl-accepting chemotaxis protein